VTVSFESGFDLTGLTNARVRTGVEGAIMAADRVHSLPSGISPVPVSSHPQLDPLGQYRGTASGDPVVLTLSEAAVDPGLIFLHEAGHYIDHHILGAAGQLASSSPPWHDWTGAVRGTQAVQRLRQMYLTPGVSTIRLSDGSVAVVPDDRAYIQYLLRVHELFARSYCQYVTLRSRDPTLANHLSNTLAFHYPEQWRRRDFRPIQKVFDRQFGDLGWRHSQHWLTSLKLSVLKPFKR
jgi:hypothetical protein